MYRLMFTLIWLQLPFASAQSQEASVVVPAETKFVVQMDVAEFGKTDLGGKLLRLTERMASEEIGEDGENVIAKVHEALGFDPLKEVRGVFVMSTSYDEPQDHLRAIVQLGQTSGNLEGLMLALPGYDSSDYGDDTIHQVDTGDAKGFVAIHTDSDKKKCLVGSAEMADLRSMLDALNDEPKRGASTRRLPVSLSGGAFAKVHVLELPTDVFDDDDPPANIIRLIRDISVSAKEDSDAISLELLVSTEEEKQAEQIRQLAQGLVAMSSLMAGEMDDDAAKIALEIATTAEVSRDENEVSIGIAVPSELVIQFLREEADLPL